MHLHTKIDQRSMRPIVACAVFADGTEVPLPEYTARQMRLMGGFAEQMIATGPESDHCTEEAVECLRRMSRGGTCAEVVNAARTLERTSDLFVYLRSQWLQRFASIFGPLAREGNVPGCPPAWPVEAVEAHVAGFQSAVVQHVGVLRHLWAQHVQQRQGRQAVLPLQSAWEQVYWVSGVYARTPEHEWIPATGRLPDVPSVETYLRVAALIPHVVVDGTSVDLAFGNGHIYPAILAVPVPQACALRIDAEIAKYRALSERHLAAAS